jgi:GNAT superfamily N-acetyltransferase
MADANFAFMARQLMQTELRGHNWSERSGGAHAAGSKLWTVLWDPAGAGDPEKLVQESQAKALELALPFAGLIALTPPAAESDPALAALEEALFVYGYPRRQGLGSGGPDMVQVLSKPTHHKPIGGLSIEPAESVALEGLLNAACAERDGLGGPGWQSAAEFGGAGIQHLVASRGGRALGFASLAAAGVTGRVMLIWVEPESRGKGIGRALLEAAARASGEGGQLVLSAWTHRDGRLRYFFAKEGYSDQLRLHYFQPEED